MSIGHTKNLPALPLGLLAPDPGDFLFGQKVTKKPLKKLRFLRIFLHYGGFDLRYDLFDPFPQYLPWADGSRIAGTSPWPFSLLRWLRLLEARFFPILPGHRHGAGGTAPQYRPLCRHPPPPVLRLPDPPIGASSPRFPRPPHLGIFYEKMKLSFSVDLPPF